MRRTYYRTYGGVAVFSDGILPPFLDEGAHILVDGLPVLQLHVLQFAARFVRRLDEYEDTLLSLVHPTEERSDAVRTEVAVHRKKVRIEGSKFASPDRGRTEIRLRVAFRRRTDIVALGVRHHEHPFRLRIAQRFRKGPHPLDAVHFVIGDLHFYAGHDVADIVDDLFIESEDGLRRTRKVFHPGAHFLGEIIERGIQPRHRGVIVFYDLIYQLIDDHCVLLNTSHRTLQGTRGWRERAPCRL